MRFWINGWNHKEFKPEDGELLNVFVSSIKLDRKESFEVVPMEDVQHLIEALKSMYCECKDPCICSTTMAKSAKIGLSRFRDKE